MRLLTLEVFVSRIPPGAFRKRTIGKAVSGSLGRCELFQCVRMLSWKGLNSLLPAKYTHSNLGPGNNTDRGPPAVRQIYGNGGFFKHPFSCIFLCLWRGPNPSEQSLSVSVFWYWTVPPLLGSFARSSFVRCCFVLVSHSGTWKPSELLCRALLRCPRQKLALKLLHYIKPYG